jgi:hypothetical protein
MFYEEYWRSSKQARDLDEALQPFLNAITISHQIDSPANRYSRRKPLPGNKY